MCIRAQYLHTLNIFRQHSSLLIIFTHLFDISGHIYMYLGTFMYGMPAPPLPSTPLSPHAIKASKWGSPFPPPIPPSPDPFPLVRSRVKNCSMLSTPPLHFPRHHHSPELVACVCLAPHRPFPAPLAPPHSSHSLAPPPFAPPAIPHAEILGARRWGIRQLELWGGAGRYGIPAL